MSPLPAASPEAAVGGTGAGGDGPHAVAAQATGDGPGTGTVQVDGPPAPVGAPSLEEVVRPFGNTGRGVTFLDGGERRTLTYHELAGAGAAVAERLRAFGVRAGDRVAGHLDNTVESVSLLMGVWAAGAAFVSLPRPGRGAMPGFAARFGILLKACGCEFVVDDEADSPLAAQAGARLIPAAALCALPPRPRHAPDAALGDLALIQFTSGSTAEPKGVAIGGGTLALHLQTISELAALAPDRDRVVSWLPLHHDMGLVVMFAVALAARTDLVLMPSSSFAFGPARWLTTVARERGTLTAGPDFAYRLAAAVPHPPGLDLSGLRFAVSGGERVNGRTLRDFRQAFEPCGLRPEAVYPSYGLAENVVCATSKPHGTVADAAPDGHVPLGVPLPGVSVRAPRDLPAGPVEIRGSSLFEGYFTVDGFAPAPRGWFDTGDAGFIRDGALHVLGRRGEVASVAGRNVFAEDLEAAAVESAGPRIRGCAAFRLAEDDQRFGLILELPPGQDPEEAAELGRTVRAAVQQAAGVRVHTLLLVRVGTIPRTTSGKARRGQCRELHRAGTLGRRLLAVLD